MIDLLLALDLDDDDLGLDAYGRLPGPAATPGPLGPQLLAGAAGAAAQARGAQAGGQGQYARWRGQAAYNDAFTARAMGLSVPESTMSAAAAAYQHRAIPVSPWLGTWQGSGIREEPVDLDAIADQALADLGI